MSAATRLIGALGGATALGALALSFNGGWEGKRLDAYRDIIGVWTICYGETYNVKPGERRTSEQCDEGHLKGLVRYEQGMRKCLDRPDALPGKVYVAFLSSTWNLGVPTFCRSSMARYANHGNLVAACNALRLYVNAGGRFVKGLDNRRRAEQKLCLEGAAEGTGT